MWKLGTYLYSVFLVGGTQNSDGKNFGGFLEIFSQEFWELGNIRKVKSLKLNYQNVRWNSLECKGWLRDPQRIVQYIKFQYVHLVQWQSYELQNSIHNYAWR